MRVVIQRFILPLFLHLTHFATFEIADSSVAAVSPSASHTGVVEVMSQPSAYPDMSLQTLHSPDERHR